jgi:hypothetical protein
LDSNPRKSKNSEIGPLPGRDRKAEIEALSRLALGNCLPIPKFLYRPEPTDDLGVDASIELLLDGQATNLRAQVQLKGTDSGGLNADGSISLAVNLSNLNYLLNGPSPLYILYIVPRDELRYVWARDEQCRIELENAEWASQKTVTLRFHNVLTSAALDEIYERVKKEARFQRSVLETIGRSIPIDQVVVGVDPETLKHTDPDRLSGLLEESGIAMVASGFASDAVAAIELLNTHQRRRPLFQVILAYAQCMLGRYDAAISAAREAGLRRNELSEDNQQFLDLLRDGCDLQAGRITAEEYGRRLGSWSQDSSSICGLTRRLEYLRHAILNTDEPELRYQMTAELHQVAEQLTARPDVNSVLALQARLITLYAEGQQLCLDLRTASSAVHLRSLTLGGANLPSGLQGLFQVTRRWSQWHEQIRAVNVEIEKQDYPLLAADGLTYYAIVVGLYLADCRLHEAATGIPAPPAEPLLASAQQVARQAAAIYRGAGYLESEVRAEVALSDLLYLAGETEEAQAVGKEVFPTAEIMGYAGLSALAEAHANGCPMFEDALNKVRQCGGDMDDRVLAGHDDDFVKKMAKRGLEMMGVPESRLANAERDMLSIRDIARERVGWCRNIELVQDLSHSQRPETYLVIDPDRHCRCSVRGYESLVGDSNWKTIITAFKQAYCAHCPDRNPMGKETPLAADGTAV